MHLRDWSISLFKVWFHSLRIRDWTFSVNFVRKWIYLSQTLIFDSVPKIIAANNLVALDSLLSCFIFVPSTFSFFLLAEIYFNFLRKWLFMNQRFHRSLTKVGSVTSENKAKKSLLATFACLSTRIKIFDSKIQRFWFAKNHMSLI